MAGVESRGKGRYRGTISLGTDPVTGKRIKHSLGTITAKNMTEARKVFAQMEVEYWQGKAVDKENITVAKFLQEYLEMNPRKLATTTIDNYRIYVEAYIIPNIGQHKVQFLAENPILLEKFKNNLLVKGRKKDGSRLSEKTVKTALNILSGAMEYAYKTCRIINSNPVDFVDKPKIPKQKTRATFTELSTSDIDLLYEKAIELDGYTMFALLHTDLNTGLARGELLALKWDSIDLEQRKLTVARVLVRHRDESDQYVYSIEERGKTEYRLRTIGLTSNAVDVLKALKREQKKLQLQLGQDYNRGLVFCNDDGSHLTFGQLRHRYDKIKKAAGIKVSFHALRHNVATKLLEQGATSWEVAKFLGHGDERQVNQTYGHYTETVDKKVVDKMERVYVK